MGAIMWKGSGEGNRRPCVLRIGGPLRTSKKVGGAGSGQRQEKESIKKKDQ